MNFNEYKNAEYWQKLRNKRQSKVGEILSEVIVAAALAMSPIIYCFANIIEG